MSIKPILFNTEMVRAELDGRKTSTRRVVKGAKAQWCFLGLDDNATITKVRANGKEYPIEVEGLWATFDGQDSYPDYPMIKSPYEPGDILWVRETWYCENHMYQNNEGDALYRYVYRASSPEYPVNVGVGEHGWKPSIHMPREAARLWLRVENVRVERLQEISADQCYSEGVEKEAGEVGAEFTRGIFSGIWDSTIKKADLPLYGWAANPWVWVFEFERCEKPQEDKQ